MSDITRGRGAERKVGSISNRCRRARRRGLGKRIAGKSKDEVTQELMRRRPEQLFSVLGELQGGAMKSVRRCRSWKRVFLRSSVSPSATH